MIVSLLMFIISFFIIDWTLVRKEFIYKGLLPSITSFITSFIFVINYVRILNQEKENNNPKES